MLDAMRFLFATDGSRGADIALDLLRALPLAGADHVTVLTVPTYSFVGTTVLDRGQAADLLVDRGDRSAYTIAARAVERLSAHGVSAAADVRAGPVTEAIEVAALENAADLIVIGSRGLGAFAGSILGSVARALARHAPVPILMVRECRSAPRRIVVAVDGSDDARAAIALLAHLPLPTDAAITLVHVLEEDGINERRAEMVLAQAARTLAMHAIDHAVIERGHVAEQILVRAAGAKTDLIVLGSRGQTKAAGLLQGSVADQVLSQAHCAVLIAKAALKPSVVAEPWLAMARGAVAL
jgi:nucleotide-binding universal stress UspA family protein